MAMRKLRGLGLELKPGCNALCTGPRIEVEDLEIVEIVEIVGGCELTPIAFMLRARDLVTLSNHRAGRCCTASAEMTKSYTKRRRRSAEAKKVNDNIRELSIEESYHL